MAVALVPGKMRQPGRLNDDVIHVGCISPVSLFSMSQRGPSVTCIDLYDVFPYNRNYSLRPRLHIAPLSYPLDSNVVLHEEIVSTNLASFICLHYQLCFRHVHALNDSALINIKYL